MNLRRVDRNYLTFIFALTGKDCILAFVATPVERTSGLLVVYGQDIVADKPTYATVHGQL